MKTGRTVGPNGPAPLFGYYSANRGEVIVIRLISAIFFLACTAVVDAPVLAADESFERTEQRDDCTHYSPLKRPLFGDLHVHTSYSHDAYVSLQRNDPWDAYRYAKGESLMRTGRLSAICPAQTVPKRKRFTRRSSRSGHGLRPSGISPGFRGEPDSNPPPPPQPVLSAAVASPIAGAL